jgi:hypothetical protein
VQPRATKNCSPRTNGMAMFWKSLERHTRTGDDCLKTVPRNQHIRTCICMRSRALARLESNGAGAEC